MKEASGQASNEASKQWGKQASKQWSKQAINEASKQWCKGWNDKGKEVKLWLWLCLLPVLWDDDLQKLFDACIWIPFLQPLVPLMGDVDLACNTYCLNDVRVECEGFLGKESHCCVPWVALLFHTCNKSCVDKHALLFNDSGLTCIDCNDLYHINYTSCINELTN